MPIRCYNLLIVLLLVSPGYAQAQSLGRLFTTQEERAALDDARNDPNFGRGLNAPVTKVEDQPTGPVVPHVTINGVVLRSSGLNASWINGSSVQTNGMTNEGIMVQTTRDARRGGSVQLAMPGGLETIQIKPGQKIDLISGGVFESYEYESVGDGALFEESADTTAAQDADIQALD